MRAYTKNKSVSITMCQHIFHRNGINQKILWQWESLLPNALFMVFFVVWPIVAQVSDHSSCGHSGVAGPLVACSAVVKFAVLSFSSYMYRFGNWRTCLRAGSE